MFDLKKFKGIKDELEPVLDEKCNIQGPGFLDVTAQTLVMGRRHGGVRDFEAG